MPTTELHPGPLTSPNAFAVLVEALWGGEISERDFVAQAHLQGYTAARIEWALDQLRNADGIVGGAA